jgi:hypothetical protein
VTISSYVYVSSRAEGDIGHKSGLAAKNEVAISNDRLLSGATKLFFQSSSSSPNPALPLVNPVFVLNDSIR